MRSQTKLQKAAQIRELTTAEVALVSGGSISSSIMSVWAGPDIDIAFGRVTMTMTGIHGVGIGGAGMALTSTGPTPFTEDS